MKKLKKKKSEDALWRIFIKMEEKTKNRLFGGLEVVIGGIFLSSGGGPILYAGGTLFLTEGVGDIISGEHHYLGSRVVGYIGDKIGVKFKE